SNLRRVAQCISVLAVTGYWGSWHCAWARLWLFSDNYLSSCKIYEKGRGRLPVAKTASELFEFNGSVLLILMGWHENLSISMQN
ncbi:MAG: hypothetical protein KDD10_17300, partial [Phaeodactylibacter sp.]|nr:hypothetical protein [Phaeodactylibacter sp.]